MTAPKQLSWNEIRHRAHAFVKEWRDERRERAEKDSFWNDFFHVYGVNRRRFVTFERNVTKLKGTSGFIDGFWPGMILVEHKSRGENLDKALKQAQEYLDVLPQHELPRFVVLSDFAEFRVWDMDENTSHAFPIEDLPDMAELFAPLAGYRSAGFEEEDEVNVKAAALLGKLHDLLDETGYTDHPLRMLLVRVLFLLFADDTGVWEKSIFADYVRECTSEDGRDLGMHLQLLFEVLDTPEGKRQSSLDEALARFPYINGDLFSERIPTASFDTAMRECLLDCSRFDWAAISPAIFGSMFQSVMKADERRQLGAHYTTEQNILKLIDPLFLDGLRAEFTDATTLASKRQKERLTEFKAKLGKLTFFDPACGCGNFLLIGYRELRLLELDVLKRLRDLETKGGARQYSLDALAASEVTVDQFYGIEVEEFPARIAQTAMYLMDHLMNQRLSQEFGLYYARFPITASATVVNANALRVDWSDVIEPQDCNYLLGNPPFIGKHYQSDEQKQELIAVLGSGAAILDYVAAWYVKAAVFIEGTDTAAAFVSTNSIFQGEQVGVLWRYLDEREIEVDFAHQTFNWKSEVRGGAAVHVVIVGFSWHGRRARKLLYLYETPNGAPMEEHVESISAYLTRGDTRPMAKRRKPLCDLPEMRYGSKPVDGGHLLLSAEEADVVRATDEVAAQYLRLCVGSDEFINGIERWCFWLVDASPADIRRSPELARRLELVRSMRGLSTKAKTREQASTPGQFGELRQPSEDYIAVPEVSSVNRDYVPVGLLKSSVVASNKLYTVPTDDLYVFGILASTMHREWLASVGGRLKSDFQYSSSLVYNNLPIPTPTPEERSKVVTAAEEILVARAAFPDATLGDLYHRSSMPPALHRAHVALDRVVDSLYLRRSRKKSFPTPADRLEALFAVHAELLA